MTYSWVNFHHEYFKKVSEYENRRKELKSIISKCYIDATGKFTFPWNEMDPFSPISMSTAYGLDKRNKIYQNLRVNLNMVASVPDDYAGIPALTYASRFVTDPDVAPESMDRTWFFFKKAIKYADGTISDDEFIEAFDQEIMPMIKGPKITMALFWMRPDLFTTLDETSRQYLLKKHEYVKITRDFKGKEYISWNADLKSKLNGWGYKSLLDLSAAAWNKHTGDPVNIYPDYNPGITVNQWKELLSNPDIFNQERLEYLRVLVKMGGSASCRQLSNSTGKKPSYFVAMGNSINRIVAKATNCARTIDDEGKPAIWPIMFEGKDGEADKGAFTWTLRKELKTAIEELHLFKEDSFDIWTMSSEKDEENEEYYPKYGPEEFLSEVFINNDDLTKLQNLLRKKGNIILQGPPGVGKTYMAKRLAYVLLGKKKSKNIKIVQFHQSYSYEDFMLGLKPTDNGGFNYQPGPFLKFCNEAANSNEPYFFIIDEINRGNISRIFGETMMLIEKSHRGENITLMYQNREFQIPDNVFIIGTMNTADRSLAILDFALRRRFAFYDVTPSLDRVKMDDPRWEDVKIKIKKLNKMILEDRTLGPGFLIGHSYFMEDLTLDEVIDNNILPLLSEYWYDDADKVENIAKELKGFD